MRADVAWALGLIFAVVLAAALVNRFVPTRRAHVRRLSISCVLFLFAFGFQLALEAMGFRDWAARVVVVTELLRAFTLVSLATVLVFSLLVPSLGLVLPMIATDLVVGVGYIAAVFIVLSRHGLNPAGALASAAVVSAVVAISLQSTLGNILGGVALQLDGSVHEGDWIELPDGRQGKVRAVRWRHTVLETNDQSTVVVPNATLLAGNIVLLGKRGGELAPQRIHIQFHVDFRHAPAQVVDLVGDAFEAADVEGVAAAPKPNCVCLDLARPTSAGYAVYDLRYYLTDVALLDPTSSRVRARIYTALQRAGVELAVPEQYFKVATVDDDRTTKRSVRGRLAALRGVPLFKTMTEPELGTLAEGLRPALYADGETITREGAVAHWLYILTRGSVDIRIGTGDRRQTLAKLTAPAVFGEMGLMTGAARAADVVALEEVECYRLDKATFETVLQARPEMAHALSDELAERRLELQAARDGASGPPSRAMVDGERDRIFRSIKSFFGL